MSDWIVWSGEGGCAMGSAKILTEVKLANGDVKIGRAADFRWSKNGASTDIIAYRLAEPVAGPAERFDAVVDMVNHPPHYTAGGIECIDAIRAALTPEEFRGHCKANAMKYIWRERNKGGDESIRKAIWYLQEMLK